MPAGRIAAYFDFLRIEADLAMTFIITARVHSKAANSARSLGNARKALAEIRQGLAKPGFTADDVAFLKRRCAGIESELRNLA